MRQVSVNMPWIVSAYENSSGHSIFYLDLTSGAVKFFDPLDFPEHAGIMKNLDKKPDLFVRLPKRDKEYCLQVKSDFVAIEEDPIIKELLKKSLEAREEKRFRSILMDFPEARRRWYDFENERYEEMLTAWFREKGIELIYRAPINELEYNKKRK